ncbi:hypothetical protein QQX98_005257 [Neonectria punicea]|uniref:Uncharacterized protein n=1 Tax=Neonectria punicea TaxID=979145 RepID=A0ABR1H5Y9_9HYPO
MVLFSRIIAQKVGSLMGDSHQQQQQPHQQDPYHVQNTYQHNTHQDSHSGPHFHPSHYHCHQPQVINGGYYMATPTTSKHQHRAERRAERHYRHAERSMQRAEHRAERDFRRAEQRGELVPIAPAMYQPAVGGQMYSGEPNGYEMRQMGYQQRPEMLAPASESREAGQAGAAPRHQFEDAPPPSYEEIQRKQ